MKVQRTPPLQPGLQPMDTLDGNRPNDAESSNLDFTDAREFLESRLPGHYLPEG
jgi:hypothetical protein